MNTNVNVCPATLREGYETYSTTALRHLFNGRKVSHQLSFSLDDAHKEQRKQLRENRTRISISGVQEKYSLRLNKRTLKLTDEHGEYILKPIPKDLENVEFVPANEHLTMQIAAQVYKMDVAKNALIFFDDGEPAYITKRFDVMQDSKRCLKEDFASLLLKTSERNGKNFKYESSYEDIAKTIDKLLPAAMIAKENVFKQIVFNYLFSNGDAHLKNFSVVDYLQDGLYQISPAYDLVCTRLHIDDSDLALQNGLYEDDYNHPSFSSYGYYGYDDFYDFGLRIGLLPIRITGIINNFLSGEEKVKILVGRSFLSDELKELYLKHYKDKLTRIGSSLSGKLND